MMVLSQSIPSQIHLGLVAALSTGLVEDDEQRTIPKQGLDGMEEGHLEGQHPKLDGK